MNYIEKEKLERLRNTFDQNYRLTHLYSSYLQNFPEIITKEMIDELTRGTDIGKEEAIAALISEIFGLNDSRTDDRRLIRDYIRPSVKLLDAKRYTSNKYYKNIKIENTKIGAWELKWESYPPYRAVICDDIKINSDYSEIAPLGFFDEEFFFPAVLEDGNEWMTLTPVDLDTSDEAIEKAHGRVVTFGLGLGYYAYMVSEKEDVESITVVEKSEDVIKLFSQYILPQFTHPEKVKIISDDAFSYAEKIMPKMNYDFAFVDTWRDASDGAPMYARMKKLEHYSPKTEFSYWIENFLISRLRAEKFEALYNLVANDSDDAPVTYEEFLERLNYNG